MKIKFVLLAALATLTLIGCSSSNPTSDNIPIKQDSLLYQWVSSVHTTLGVPYDADTTDDYIIVRPQYVLSYNHLRNECNWVSWELNRDWYGDVDRYSGNFITDTSLPAGFYRVKHSDYTNSGYDRGHMVRSEERTATIEDNKSTFLLTNIIPQRPDMNQGVWLNLEYHLEDLCKDSSKEIFVMSGGVYHSSVTIGNGVAVPDSCFKIAIVLNSGQSLADVNAETEVIAVMMPNMQGVRKDKWEQYKTTIHQIEESTGYHFLPKVSKNIRDIIEYK